MKPRYLIAAMLLLLVFAITKLIPLPEIPENQTELQSVNDQIHKLYANKTSNTIVTGSGIVTKLLPDDTKGIRHQKFILTLDRKLTILVAHNIDIAPRITDIKQGDTVSFKGQYEWNKKGGVVHWTHHDPKKKHKDGWILHNGRKFQ